MASSVYSKRRYSERARCMTAKRQSAKDALSSAARCVSVCVKSAASNPDAFQLAWQASRDALNEESLPAEARDIIRQIVLDVLVNITNVRKTALDKARSESKNELDKARSETKRAVDAAIKERKAQEFLALAVVFCVAAAVALYFTPCPYALIVPLAFVLAVLKFHKPLEAIVESSRLLNRRAVKERSE